MPRDAWKQFQKYSPKYGGLMAIYYGAEQKIALNKSKY